MGWWMVGPRRMFLSHDDDADGDDDDDDDGGMVDGGTWKDVPLP